MTQLPAAALLAARLPDESEGRKVDQLRLSLLKQVQQNQHGDYGQSSDQRQVQETHRVYLYRVQKTMRSKMLAQSER